MRDGFLAGRARLAVAEPRALLLRLRKGFGVGIKADVLGFLLGIQGAWASAREITEAAAYTSQAVRRALEDMAEARLLEGTRETPAKYRLNPRGWLELLGVSEGFPAWRYWHPVFALVAAVLDWRATRSSATATPYLLSSRARDLIERHQAAFRRNRIGVPHPEDYPAERYLQAFEETLRVLAQWMEENV